MAQDEQWKTDKEKEIEALRQDRIFKTEGTPKQILVSKCDFEVVPEGRVSRL